MAIHNLAWIYAAFLNIHFRARVLQRAMIFTTGLGTQHHSISLFAEKVIGRDDSESMNGIFNPVRFSWSFHYPGPCSRVSKMKGYVYRPPTLYAGENSRYGNVTASHL